MTVKAENCHFGITVPKTTLRKLDAMKDPYYSLSKFFLKIINEYLDEKEVAPLKGEALQRLHPAADATTTTEQPAEVTAATRVPQERRH